MEHDTTTGDKMKGTWKQFKGKIREKWGDVTDDELDRVQGRREQLAGYLQKKSGEERQKIDKDLDRWSSETGYRL